VPLRYTRRALLALAALAPLRVAAQQNDTTPAAASHVPVAPAHVLGAPADEWRRLAELSDTTLTPAPLLRSPSSSWAPLTDGERAILPYLNVGRSTGMPLEENDGALWAGLGYSLRAVAGIRADYGRLHLVIAPEAVISENHEYPLPFPQWYVGFPTSRNEWASPFYAGPHSADLPLRMGDRNFRRIELGQSAAYADAGPVAVGFSTENEWWGPGVRNAILLGSAAPGFLHAFVRTRSPIVTRAGTFDARWLVGGLVESLYFDGDRANDVRSISALAFTWTTPWEPGLTLGVARSVFAPASGWGRVFGDFYQVFSDVGTPNDRDASDSTITPGRDQLFSLFGRWVLPRDGFEFWFEWARSSQPTSLRDVLVDPAHSQGYTVGTQWLSPTRVGGGRPRILAEFTYLEQSPSYRNRPEGWMYASRSVIQGYTNRGQPLGATFGVGGSSQYVELGWVRDSWLLGATLTRVRYNDDKYEGVIQDISYCRHDVALLPGGRASWRSRFGDVGLDYRAGLRLTPLFRYTTPNCNYSSPDDRRLSSLRLTLVPSWPWSGGGSRD
jgi:hypothetical protein